MSTTPLSPQQMSFALAELPEWSWENNALAKTHQFPSFRAAISFMHRASFLCEAVDHHPEWTNVQHTVVIKLKTHEAGGCVTARDLDLARKLQRLLRSSGGDAWTP